MRNSLIITALILLVGIVPALWRKNAPPTGNPPLAESVSDRKTGAATRTEGRPAKRTTSRREQARREHGGNAAATLDLAKLIAAAHGSGAEDKAARQQAAAFFNGLEKLSPGEIRTILAGLWDATEIPASKRRSVIGFALFQISKDRPEAALELAAAIPGALEDNTVARRAAATSLKTLAAKDPQAALAWLRGQAGKNHGSGDLPLRSALIAGIAENDPAAALRALPGLETEPGGNLLETIARSGSQDPDKRMRTLAALRGYLAALPAEERAEKTSDALSAMARNLDREDFESVSGWLEDAEMKPDELAGFANGLDFHATKTETGKWLGWLGGKLGPEKSAEAVMDLMGEWTQEDYQAAGQWLAAAPAGAVKDSAVIAYAEAVAEYDPQAAEQWAVQIPAGARREQALHGILDNWPSADAAGAASFAQKHGLTAPGTSDP